MPHSEVAEASPAKRLISMLQCATSTVCRTTVVTPITSRMKSAMSLAGNHGAPSRAVMSEGRRSSGCTRSRAATLRA